MVYRVSSRTARAVTERNPVLKNKNETNKQSKTKTKKQLNLINTDGFINAVALWAFFSKTSQMG